jgi:hypothetical protein
MAPSTLYTGRSIAVSGKGPTQKRDQEKIAALEQPNRSRRLSGQFQMRLRGDVAVLA